MPTSKNTTKKYGNQVIFGRLNHIASSLRHLVALWEEYAEICRYRCGTQGAMLLDPEGFERCECSRSPDNIVSCHWSHCTVDENTEDKDLDITDMDDLSVMDIDNELDGSQFISRRGN